MFFWTLEMFFRNVYYVVYQDSYLFADILLLLHSMLYFCCSIFINKFHHGVIHWIHKKNISNVKQMHEYCINSIYLLHALRTPLFVLDSVSWTVWVPKVCLLFGWAAVSQDIHRWNQVKYIKTTPQGTINF